jgi:protein-S-isoprenylcysteine O-methyltransferase Ste14
MMVPGSSILSPWANNLNLLGSILYLLAVLITRVPITQIIAIIGDIVYFIDAIMYLICWFSDRQTAKAQGEQVALVTK